MTASEPPQPSTARAISNATAGVFAAHAGRGPSNARAEYTGDVVTVIMNRPLSEGEQTLVDGGHGAEVLRFREVFQQVIRAPLTVEIERITGRTVIAFMSANHLDPAMAAEIFVLEAA